MVQNFTQSQTLEDKVNALYNAFMSGTLTISTETLEDFETRIAALEEPPAALLAADIGVVEDVAYEGTNVQEVLIENAAAKEATGVHVNVHAHHGAGQLDTVLGDLADRIDALENPA